MSEGDLKLVTIRTHKESDINYIYSSWLEDFVAGHHLKQKPVNKYKQTYVAMMHKNLYYKEQRAKIDRILAKSLIKVACNSEDEDQIFGYIVFRYLGPDIGIVSWFYVKPVFREHGIGNLLMKSVGPMDIVTHLPPDRKWILEKYNLIFNPYMEDKIE